MKLDLIERLRCPISNEPLTLEQESAEYSIDGNEVISGWLLTCDNKRYPIVAGIPRFVPSSNYADNFGMQWNHFRQTQLDSYSGHPISADRFWQATGWNPKMLKNQWVLDAGCGAGRFAEVALLAGAKVVALDYSSAVDACYANLKHHPNLHVVQGDIYALPFAPQSFPFVYSLGVLQHTPDVGRAFAALPPMVCNGGRLCADFYWNRLRSMIHPKYLLRPFTKRMNHAKLFQWLTNWVPTLLSISRAVGRVPVLGRVLKLIVPVANYTGRFPLSEQQLKEWALLDTFDWFAPTYDNPQSAATVQSWFEQAGLQEIEVGHWGHLVGRGIKPINE